ncbi:MAG: VOC family protein [Paracoccaceae bacterium]
MRLDHIAVAGRTLEEAADWVEQQLGVPLQKGGEHERFGTHNKLLGLDDGVYLEAIASNPNAPTPNQARWFDLDNFDGSPRLTNWICQVDDLDETLRDLPQAGRIVDLSRGDLRWRMGGPENGILSYDNCFPAFIEWQTPQHPSAMLTRRGCRLRSLTVSHPSAEELRHTLAPYLELGVMEFEIGACGLAAEIETPSGIRRL